MRIILPEKSCCQTVFTILMAILLQKFEELLQMQTEAVKDQLNDIFNSFKYLVEAHKLSFVQVEQQRRDRFKKLGGFDKGLYLVGVSKTKGLNRLR